MIQDIARRLKNDSDFIALQNHITKCVDELNTITDID